MILLPRASGRLPGRVFLFLLLCAALPMIARGQAEHVEIGHPVYDFLNRLQVRQVVEGFSRTVLPLERKQVTQYLRDAAARSELLSEGERAVLARYTDEFVAEADGTQRAVVLLGTDFPGSLGEVFGEEEKFLYRWQSADRSSTLYLDLLASLEYRTLLAEQGNANVTLGQIGGRFRGTLGGLVGYTLTATNGTAMGNRSLAMNDPQLRRNFNYAALDKEFFDLTEAVLSITWDWGSASFGKEKRLWGTGRSQWLLLSGNAQPFDALRIDAAYGDVRFSFLHGSVLSEVEMLEGGRPYYDAKYVAMHRVEADVFDALRFGVFESVVYSGREVDLAYLNPVNFYKSAEHAGGDRDNPMLGFELSTLGLRNLELYGSWLIDDVDFSRLGDSWWGNKFIFQAGAISTVLPNTDITAEYTRINPYVYTHRLRGNQYTHNGEALGVELAPNSEEYMLDVTHWCGARLRLGARAQYIRHGRNVRAADGTLLVNNGAEIYESRDYERDREIALFLAGPRDETLLATLSLRYEPWRNMALHARYRFRTRESEIDGKLTDHFLSAMLELAL